MYDDQVQSLDVRFLPLTLGEKGKVKAHTALKAHTAGAYPGFCSIKHLGVLLLPTGWDASPT